MKDNKHWEWVDTFIPEHINLLESYEYYIADDREAMKELQIYIRTKDNERWYNFISERFDLWGDAYSWAEEIVGKLQEEYPDKELGREEIEYLTEAIYDRDESNYEKCILQYAHNIVFTWKIKNAYIGRDIQSIEEFVEQVGDHEVLKRIPFGIMMDIYRNLIYDGGEFIIGFRLSREDIDKLIEQKNPIFYFNDVFFGVQNYEVGAGYTDRFEEFNLSDSINADEIEIDDLHGDYGWSAWTYQPSIKNAEIK